MRIKKNILKISLILMGVLVFQTSNAQKNYLPGYIIDQDGQKVQGFIDYRNWEKNPDKINFKVSTDGEKKEFTPADIKEFAVKDEIYVGAIVETEVSPSKTNQLTESADLKIVVDTTFLRTMIKGEKSLYYFKTKNGKENFYIEQNSEYVLLIHKRYLRKQKSAAQGKLVVAENKKYIGQLKLYLNNCPEIQSKFRGVGYNKKNINKLFTQYYENTQLEIEFQKKTEKLKFDVGVLAGASSTSINFVGEIYPYIVNADYSQSVNFTTGLFIDIIFPRTKNKLSFNNELIYTSYKVEGTYSDFTHENWYTNYYTKLGYSYIKFNNMLRFRFPIKKLFLYVNGGLSTGYKIGETSYKREEIVFYTQETIEEGVVPLESQSFELGLVYGVGAKFNRYSIDIRYERIKGLNEYYYLESTIDRFYFLVGYSF